MASKRSELALRQRNSLGYLLIRCGQLWNERAISMVNEQAGRVVLREAHTRLIPLLQDPAGVRISELARRTGVTKQAIHALVSELAEWGLVRLVPDRNDARAKRVHLTAFGLEAALHGTSVLEAIEGHLAQPLGLSTVKHLKEGLRHLLRHLDETRTTENVQMKS